ncbi:RHS repeat-associated core domain-containing protein [Chryseobacterium gwangjuense]|uniref:RHS repeat-associated core domain-containing protein n=1 Tax=Chryseobacterium gwangjuense TaxID=1069980 RepID=UPI00293E440B|nr:RHS repeat-associated core domain-containing protein [Chryseobacterium gwangjuense]
MAAQKLLKKNNYYPFGLKHQGYNQTQGNPSYNYQYNGKELQEETGWNDYGARMYMSDIGRWGVIDPLSETSRRFTPYNYAYNNPISFIDPDGRKVQTPDQIETNVFKLNAPENSLWFAYANGGYGTGGGDGMGDFFTQMNQAGGGAGSASADNNIQSFVRNGVSYEVAVKVSQNGAISFDDYVNSGGGFIVAGSNDTGHQPKTPFKVYDSDGDYVGKMKVEAYDLYTDPVTDEQGIHIEVKFTSASEKYSDYQWVQTVGTNDPDGGGSKFTMYNDPHRVDGNNGPFYYAKSDYTNPDYGSRIRNGNKYVFTDSPTRGKTAHTIGWRAELSLVGFNSSGAHAVHTLYYGFNLYPSGHDLRMPIYSIPYRNHYWWLKK